MKPKLWSVRSLNALRFLTSSCFVFGTWNDTCTGSPVVGDSYSMKSR